METRRAVLYITDVMGVVSTSISVYRSELDGGHPDTHVFSCAATTHGDPEASERDWARDALVSLIEHL